MIFWVKGDIFQTECDTIVNPVDCSGWVSKGLSGMIAKKFPNIIEPYKILCKEKKLTVGNLWFYPGTKYNDSKNVLCFPIKAFNKSPLNLRWIEEGLKKFVSIYKTLPLKSIAFPAIGTSSVNVSWENDVRPLMKKYLDNITDIRIEIYEYAHADKVNASDILQDAPIYAAKPEYAQAISSNEQQVVMMQGGQMPQQQQMMMQPGTNGQVADIRQMTRTVYYTGDGVYIPVINKVIDMYDFNNSSLLTWNEAVFAAQFQGKTLPTKKDSLIILYYLDEINDCLIKNGGVPIQYNLWTSLEAQGDTACVCNIQDCNFHYSFKVNKGPARFITAL